MTESADLLDRIFLVAPYFWLGEIGGAPHVTDPDPALAELACAEERA